MRQQKLSLWKARKVSELNGLIVFLPDRRSHFTTDTVGCQCCLLNQELMTGACNSHTKPMSWHFTD